MVFKNKPLFSKKLWLPLLYLLVGFGCYFLSLTFGKAQQYEFTPETVTSSLPGQKLQLSCIDVGQGEAMLIGQDGHWALLDAGAPDAGEAVVAFLKTKGVDSLDYLILSHLHADHVGGVQTVLQAVEVRQLIIPGTESAAKQQFVEECTIEQAADGVIIQISTPVCGEEYPLGAAVIRILLDGTAIEDDNENCLVTQLMFDGFTALMAGDSGEVTEQQLLDTYPDLHADLFKVSHHGSSSSNSVAFLNAIQPRVALISCAAENDYGHPHSAVLERLAEVGVRVFRTDTDGTVEVTAQDGRVTVYPTAVINLLKLERPAE